MTVQRIEGRIALSRRASRDIAPGCRRDGHDGAQSDIIVEKPGSARKIRWTLNVLAR